MTWKSPADWSAAPAESHLNGGVLIETEPMDSSARTPKAWPRLLVWTLDSLTPPICAAAMVLLTKLSIAPFVDTELILRPGMKLPPASALVESVGKKPAKMDVPIICDAATLPMLPVTL